MKIAMIHYVKNNLRWDSYARNMEKVFEMVKLRRRADFGYE